MPVFPMQLHDLGSLMTKGLAEVELLHASVDSGKSSQGGETYQSGSKGSITFQDPEKDKPTRV